MQEYYRIAFAYEVISKITLTYKEGGTTLARHAALWALPNGISAMNNIFQLAASIRTSIRTTRASLRGGLVVPIVPLLSISVLLVGVTG
jgi:hypothetical protein